MSKIFGLSKRHMKVYLRDKTSVFFSFLSIIILLAIYLLFLGDMIPSNELLTSAENARFKLGYMLSGILVVGTLTLPLGVIGSYVTDIESKRFNSYLVMPIRRRNITISYFISTFLLAFVLVSLMFLAAVIYIGISTSFWLGFVDILAGIGIVALYLAVSVPIILFLVSFIKSSNAFGGLSSLVGTLIGFLSGIYIPLSALDVFTRNVASLLPFSHMTIYLKRFLIGNDILSKMPKEVLDAAGISDLAIFGLNVPAWALVAIFLGLSVVLLTFTYLRMNKKSAS